MSKERVQVQTQEEKCSNSGLGLGGPGGAFVLGELAALADEERRAGLMTGQSGGWPPKGVARDLRPIPT
jgi:hypothetical protein